MGTGPAEFPATFTLADLMADVEWRRSTIRRAAEDAIAYMWQAQQALLEALPSYCKGIPEAEAACRELIREIDVQLIFERATYLESDAPPAPEDSCAGRWRLFAGRTRPRGRRFRRTARSTRAGPQSSDSHLDEPHEHRRAAP